MRNPFVILLIGTPLSGKSTWIKNNYPHILTICRDEIILQNSKFKDYDSAFEEVNQKEIDKILEGKIIEASRNNENVIIDMTNLSSKRRARNLGYFSRKYYKIGIVFPILENSLPKGWMPAKEDILINPTGRFVIGGPDGDTGLTGRKIIVDTYGGAAPHGGGAFSGKDPTKVDRSGAYMMRYLAKNIVASGLADRCTCQVAYSIGLAKPLSLYLTTHRTGKVDDQAILEWTLKNVDLRPQAIRERLNLNSPIYLRTASYGHFGRSPQEDGGFSWERTDLVDQLKQAFTK